MSRVEETNETIELDYITEATMRICQCGYMDVDPATRRRVKETILKSVYGHGEIVAGTITGRTTYRQPPMPSLNPHLRGY